MLVYVTGEDERTKERRMVKYAQDEEKGGRPKTGEDGREIEEMEEGWEGWEGWGEG